MGIYTEGAVSGSGISGKIAVETPSDLVYYYVESVIREVLE